jgi:membrane protein implicated in regulation of membrane protease activity
MPWWSWLVIGFLLLAGEMLTPGGFYLLFFGLGALAVGLLGLVGLEGPIWLQWILFSVLSVGALVLLRPRLLGRMRTPSESVEDGPVGELARAEVHIDPGDVGRGELRGTTWTLQNVGDTPLSPGDRCRVERVDGLTLHVRKGTA